MKIARVEVPDTCAGCKSMVRDFTFTEEELHWAWRCTNLECVIRKEKKIETSKTYSLPREE